MEKNMTALVSCFVRGYHYKNSDYRILKDSLAERILGQDYPLIQKSLESGISFFHPTFKGTKEEGLRWIIDNQLSPSVLGRSAFSESSLKQALKLGCKEYLIFASGYDTSFYRMNLKGIKVFEMDQPEMMEDKKERLKKNNIDFSNVQFIKCDLKEQDWIQELEKSGYDSNQISFSSLLGISYYLTKEEFFSLIQSISNQIKEGSSIVFDYPTYEESKETKQNELLAQGAKASMKSKYTYREIEKKLSENGLLIYEHLDHQEMTNTYFYDYNTLHPQNKIKAPKGVCYCLAVKKEIHC